MNLQAGIPESQVRKRTRVRPGAAADPKVRILALGKKASTKVRCFCGLTRFVDCDRVMISPVAHSDARSGVGSRVARVDRPWAHHTEACQEAARPGCSSPTSQAAARRMTSRCCFRKADVCRPGSPRTIPGGRWVGTWSSPTNRPR